MSKLREETGELVPTQHVPRVLIHIVPLQIPTLSAHFDPYSDYPLPPPPSSSNGHKEKEEDREEASLCPGGRLLSLNVSAAAR